MDGDPGPEGPKGQNGGIIQYIGGKPIEVNDIQKLTMDCMGGSFTLALKDGTQRLTVDADGGTFSLGLGSTTTPPLSFDISTVDLQTNLQTLVAAEFTLDPAVADVGVTGSVGDYTISFEDELADQNIDLLTVDGTLLTKTGDSAVANVAFGEAVTGGLACGIHPSNLQPALQTLLGKVFMLPNGIPDAEVTLEDKIYRILFVDELADQTVDLLMVDGLRGALQGIC
jgi:hypothetical protein